jgi:hypothetical protein
MPLPDSERVGPRRIGEWALRVVSLAIMLVILMRAWSPRRGFTRAISASQRTLPTALPSWSVGQPGRIHLSVDSVLSPRDRDWVAALARAGTIVTWSSSRMAPVAATLTRAADPGGMSELAASGTSGKVMLVRDATGVLDSGAAQNGGITVGIPSAPRRAGVSADGVTAWAVSPDSVIFKRLLVEGAASWETKFTIAALAERGWKVDAITHVAPGVDVREGTPEIPDTSRYAAAIAVDSTATIVSRGASAFVNSGGGLVTLHDARSLGPGGAGSVILERRKGGEVRASRVGHGRVIRVGYSDLWRERMAGDDSVSDPVAAHRAWLARVVAAVAYAPRVATANNADADPAPLADMVDRIGLSSASRDHHSPLANEVPSGVLFGILIASLLLELVSRRLRGVR